MMGVRKYYFVPDEFSIFVHWIGAKNLSVRMLLSHSSLSGVLGIEMSLYLEYTEVLWPSTRSRPFLPHSTSRNLYPDHEHPLLRFVAERTSASESRRPSTLRIVGPLLHSMALLFNSLEWAFS